jgi:hypothetical protein
MEAICSSETSVDTQWTTRRHIPEDDTSHNHRCENIETYIAYVWLVLLFIRLVGIGLDKGSVNLYKKTPRCKIEEWFVC